MRPLRAQGRATVDLPNRFVEPYGPGWALVGDAIDAGLTGRQPPETAMAGYRRARDRAALAMYRMTIDLASFGPQRPEQELLLAALARRQADTDRFLAVLSGVVPIPEFFGPGHLLRLLGPRGLARMVLARISAPGGRSSPPGRSRPGPASPADSASPGR